MSLYVIYQDIKAHGFETVLLIVLIAKLIEISPIKLNPWTALRNWCQKVFNGNVTEKLDKLDQKLDEHIREDKEAKVSEMRASIIAFADDITDGRAFRRETYEQYIVRCDEYAAYCRENNIENGVIEESTTIIRNAYRIRRQQNSFVQSSFYIPPKGASK